MAVNLTIGAIGSVANSGASTAAGSASTAGQATGMSFADALQNAASSTVGELRNAEQISAQALQGKADIRDVTDAVMNAQQNLQAAIAIRDKIVTAFLEISRMQI
jgi:flagellar hook-basal body complex protein FliE